MADIETKKATKPKVAKAAPTHPKYSDMVSSAITALKERTGSSRVAILKYMVATYKLDEKVASVHVKVALRRGVEKGLLKQVKGTGANGSFKVVKLKPEPKKIKKTQDKKGEKTAKKISKKTTKTPADKKDKTLTKKVKKPTTKKASVKKQTTKKAAAKKPATKKTATKKPATKKPTSKSAPAKKSATKKTATKKTATKK